MSWFGFGSSQASSKPPAGLHFKLGLVGGGSQPPSNYIPLVGGKTGATSPITPTWDVDKDTNRLFQEHGVDEMKEIEKQARLDIDRRREDLRQMVG